MGRFIDLTGQRFERLLVISRAKDYVSPAGTSHVQWNCQCDCGNKTISRGGALKLGKVKSCSCLKNEHAKKLGIDSFIDISNKKFGLLTTISIDHIHKRYGRYWLCACECGNKVVVLGSNLRKNNTTSCGCLTDSKISFGVKKYIGDKYNAKIEYCILKNKDTNHYLPYDIYIPTGDDLNINGVYIEIHGLQHYYLNGWHHRGARKNNTTPKEEFDYQKYKDKLKRKFAKKNGIYIEVDLRRIKTLDEAIIYIENILEKQGLTNVK